MKVVVLDEAQAIKKIQSLTAQSAFRLQADFRLTLTGTPIENRLTELWSQIHFCAQAYLVVTLTSSNSTNNQLLKGNECCSSPTKQNKTICVTKT